MFNFWIPLHIRKFFNAEISRTTVCIEPQPSEAVYCSNCTMASVCVAGPSGLSPGLAPMVLLALKLITEATVQITHTPKILTNDIIARHARIRANDIYLNNQN